jgi:predicted nucleic acid-binding protein
LKRFFDSSVLIPVFYADHSQHAPSAKSFLEAGRDGFCALRTLGEVYATLTGLPLRPRISGPEATSIVKQIRDRLTLISLSEQEYVSALEQASAGAIVGAAAYDALIAHCALKAGADVLLTWNVRDFTRLGTSVARLVKTPLELT